ncbi:MAG: TolC family protein, partial [Thermoguttaceae bacterium]
YESARQILAIQCQKAENDALLAAYNVAFSYQKCRILTELTDLSTEAEHFGKSLVAAKEIGRSEYLEMKIQVERTRMALRDAQIQYKTSCRELVLLLKLPETDSIVISDAIEEMPCELFADSLFAEIRAMSPELRHARDEVKMAQSRLKRECAEAGIDYNTNAKVTYNSDTKDAEFSVGVSVPLRIFDRNQGNIQRARSELAAAQRNEQRVELAMATKFQRLFGEYSTARNRVMAYQNGILGEARESLELTMSAYKHGEQSSLELIVVQRTLFSVQIEYLENIQHLVETQLLLQGFLLSGGLEKP